MDASSGFVMYTTGMAESRIAGSILWMRQRLRVYNPPCTHQAPPPPHPKALAAFSENDTPYLENQWPVIMGCFGSFMGYLTE